MIDPKLRYINACKFGILQDLFKCDFNKESQETISYDKIDIDYQDKLGNTGLMYALSACYGPTLDYLLSKNPNVSIKNNEGETALFFCKSAYYLELLIKKIDDIDHRNNEGQTVLMKACQLKDEDSILFLVKNGADFYAENDKSLSASKILKRKRNLSPALQKFLLDEIVICNDSVTPGL